MKIKQKFAFSVLFSAITFALTSQIALAQETNKETAKSTPLCSELAPTVDKKALEDCLLEHIEVKGRFMGFEVPEVVGRVYLNRNYIERAPKTSGDINELLTRLAGVQASEDLYAAKQMGEIRARDLSISGGQPWQTGFFIDGINFNSRIDPGQSNSIENDGVSQAFTVNSRLVEQVALYDSNIPVEFGSFSGGVVDIRTRSPKDFTGSTFGFEYRTAQDSLGSYHIVEENQDRIEDLSDQVPNYNIHDVGLYGVLKINDDHSLLLDISYTESEIDELSLNQFVHTYRENVNALLKYTMTNVGFDRQDFTLTYAPYENNSILPHVLGSRQYVDQGGYAAQWQLEHDFKNVSWQSALAFNTSDNSRQAAAHYKPWVQAKGRDWGQYDPGNDETIANANATPTSVEGNHGSLEKTQENISWRQKFLFDSVLWGGIRHQWLVGSELDQQSLNRIRQQDHYNYGLAKTYSSNSFPLNCNGFYQDCIELSLTKPLSDLANDLGGVIDFTNLEHLGAYEANIITTSQYFNMRKVYAAENIEATVKQGALFASNQMELGRLQLNAGLRYSYDDFFKNHNIAPRLSAGYQLDESGNQLLSLGLNRYYDANLISYRMRELETPYYEEYRPLHQGVLQNWLRSSNDSDYRYRYTDVSTPYNDELSLSYKLATDLAGTFALKAVKRWKKDQLASSGDPVIEADGYLYRQQDNSASGTYERVSLSWHYAYSLHSFWANLSWQNNWVSTQSYDEKVDTTSLDELVALRDAQNVISVLSLTELNRQNLNFNRPVKLDFGMSSDWLDWFDTSLNFSYVQSYTTAELTESLYAYTLGTSCPSCEVSFAALPIYKEVDKKARLMTDLSMRFTVWDGKAGRLMFTADINNLFNQRTYYIASGANGIERGRQVWLGVKYDFQ